VRRPGGRRRGDSRDPGGRRGGRRVASDSSVERRTGGRSAVRVRFREGGGGRCYTWCAAGPEGRETRRWRHSKGKTRGDNVAAAASEGRGKGTAPAS
jgi:hypothetical protein